MKLDILAFGAHPDDVEMSCSGTLLRMKAAGKKTGVIDLTRGELGSRGSAELRDEEAAEASKILGLSARENLRLRDGFFTEDEESQMAVIRMLRKYRPEIIFANATHDRHPDHGKGSRLVRNAAFLSGLRRIETTLDGKPQEHWRPKRYYFYMQDHYMQPDFVVDISDYFQGKMDSIAAYSSQFYDPNSKEPETYISSKDFWAFMEARARAVGHLVEARYGEGFFSETPLKVNDPFSLI